MTRSRAAAVSQFDPERVSEFSYRGYDWSPSTGILDCHYALDDLAFTSPQDRIRVIILNDKRLLDSGKNDRTHKTETGIRVRADQRFF